VQKSVKCSHCFLQQSLSASSQNRNQTAGTGWGGGTYGTEVLPRTFSGYPFNVYFKNIQNGCTLLSIIAFAFLKYTRLYLLVVIKIFYNIFWNKGSGFFLETRDIGFFIKPKNIKNQRPFTTREYCLENYFYNNILAVKKSYFSIDRLINMIY